MKIQVSILSGSDIEDNGEIVDFFPVNLRPIVNEHGISGGYLSSTEGVSVFSDGVKDLGSDAGGCFWGGKLYRVIGGRLVGFTEEGHIDSINVIGVSSGSGRALFSNSFDDLGICYSGSFFIHDGKNLDRVYSEDINDVDIFGMVWIDGYFLLCGESKVFITELTDSKKISNVNYISSEIEPDPIKGLVKLDNSLYVMNEHSIEVFENTGRKKFPFERVSGGGADIGPIGRSSFCVAFGGIVLLGGRKNEGVGLWFFSNGVAKKVGGRTIDLIIGSYSREKLEDVLVEHRRGSGIDCLYVHFTDRTLVFDATHSGSIGEGVWFILENSAGGKLPYPARNFVNCFDKWIAGDPNSGKVGELVSSNPSLFGVHPKYEFRSGVVYSSGFGSVINEVSLESSIGGESKESIGCSSSADCKEWSSVRWVKLHRTMHWLRQGLMKNRRIYRFTGSVDIPIKILRMDISVSKLYR